MKRTMILATALICLALFLCTGVLASEFDGFRGIRWGQHISSLRKRADYKFVEEFDGIKYYKRLNDRMHFGDARVMRVYYAFTKDRFSGVVMSVWGTANSARLYDALVTAYGSPTGRGSTNAIWRTNNLLVEYRRNDATLLTTVMYSATEQLPPNWRERFLEALY